MKPAVHMLLAMVALYPDVEVEPVTAEKVEEWAEAALLECSVMRYLLRHARCVVGRPEAVSLEPALTEPGGLLGCCAHCGGDERLLTIYPVVDQASAVYYWRALGSAVATQCADLFSARQGESGARRYSACIAAFNDAISRCALLCVQLATQAETH